MRTCKNCGKEIRYTSTVVGGWIHTDSRSVFCGNDAKRLAEPKRGAHV